MGESGEKRRNIIIIVVDIVCENRVKYNHEY